MVSPWHWPNLKTARWAREKSLRFVQGGANVKVLSGRLHFAKTHEAMGQVVTKAK